MKACGWIWLAAALLGFASPAFAQGREENWTRCRNADADTSIAGCTAIIEAPGGTARDRALAFNNRGNARYRKGDADHAITPSIESPKNSTGAAPVTLSIRSITPP